MTNWQMIKHTRGRRREKFSSSLGRKKKPNNFRSHFAVPKSGINLDRARGGMHEPPISHTGQPTAPPSSRMLGATAGAVGVTETLVTTAVLQRCDHSKKSSRLPANLLVFPSPFPHRSHLHTVLQRMLSSALPPSGALLTQRVSRSSSPRHCCFEEGCVSRGPKAAPL